MSVVMWFRARDERREAARQATKATDAAIAGAGHLARIADVQVEQHEITSARLTVQERDPWQLQRIGSNEANLYNDTTTPKYGVEVEIRAGDQLWSEETISFVGPQRSAPIDFMDLSLPMSATITWHLAEDCSDTIPPQIITW